MAYLGRLAFPVYATPVGGTATAQVTADQDWIVNLTAVALDVIPATSASTVITRVYLGAANPENVIGQSQVGYGDVDDTWHFVTAGEMLTVTWTTTGSATRAMCKFTGLRFDPGTGWQYWLGARHA